MKHRRGPLVRVVEGGRRWRVCAAGLLLALGATAVQAADHRFQILLDTDNNALTGCTIATAHGPAAGIEQVWTTVVTTTTSGASVTRIERQTCNGGTLGPSILVPTAGWPAGVGNGVANTAAIETYVPLSVLPPFGAMTVWVASTNATGGQDATAPFVVSLGAAPPAAALPVPLSPWLLLPLAALLIGGTEWLRRRDPRRVALLASIVIVTVSSLVWAATVTLDGNINDWLGIAAVAGNPKGSAPVDANIVGVYYQFDAANLYFRIDADVRPDAPGNVAPVVAAGTDQTITLPVVANLNGTASDDGLPNPPGALTLNWTVFAGPAPVIFGNPAAAVTTATFTQAGLYTLRLTANDGALSASSDTHVTVNASGPLFLSIADRTIPLGARFQQVLAANEFGVGNTLTYSLLTAPAAASLNPSPLVDWTPTATQLGSNTFTAKVTDTSGHTATTTFHVTVVYVDHPPQLGAQADVTLPVGAAFTRTLTATDPDAGDTLTFALMSGPAGMTLTGAVLNWATTGKVPGDYPVTVKVTDGSGLFDSKTFVIRLTASSPPVANDDQYQVVLGNTLTVSVPGVLGNDNDPQGNPLTAAKLTDPDKGTLSAFNADGSFTYHAPSALGGPVFSPVVRYHVDFLGYSDPPLVADVDGDGKPELIFPGVGGSAQAGISAVRGTDGSVLWHTASLPAPYSDCEVYYGAGGLYHLAIGDIDDSGQLSIVASTSCGRDNLPTGIVGTNSARYLALNAKDGTVKWLSPPLSRELDAAGNPDSLAGGTVPTLARVRVGETPSIVVGLDASYFLFNGKPECDQLIPGWPVNVMCRGVIVLDGKDGAVRQRMAAPTAFEFDGTSYGNGFQAAVVADLDGDGNVEFVFGGAVFNNDGSVRSNNNSDGTGYSLTLWSGLGNFDDTPDIEVARLEGSPAGSGGGYRLAVYKSDGRLLWSLPLPATGQTGLPVIADVDGTGRPAIVFNVDGNVCAIDYRGNYKWCHDVGAPAGVSNISVGSRVQVYDLDGDGVPEVIVQVNGEILLFLDGATGNVKYSFDLGAANGPPFYPPYLDYGVGGPIVADFDGSGHAAIAVLWGGVGRLEVIGAAGNDWRPVRKIFNQESYQFGNVNDDGTIPKVFINNFATPATDVFGTQPQLLTPVDPRKKVTTSFTYSGSDGSFTSAPGTVTIDILPTNRPPVFGSTPPTRYIINSPFSYAAQAIDPDPGDTLTYSLKLAQGSFYNCAIAPTTGVLSCAVLLSGEQDFVIVATDSQGASAYQNIQMQQSAGAALVPDVVGQTQAAAGTTLTGAGFTTGAITEVFNPAPAGQVLSQAPAAGTSALLGEAVALSVSQGLAPVAVPFVVGEQLQVATSKLAGVGFSQTVTLASSTTMPMGVVMAQSPVAGTLVAPIPANPVALTVSSGSAPDLANVASIVVKPGVAARVVRQNAPFTAAAIYNNGTSADFSLIVTWASTVPGTATVDVTGNAHAVGSGATNITATIGGRTGQATLNVVTRVAGDVVSPTALITAPANGATVTAITPVMGTATDANFLRYELAIAAAGDTNYTLIGDGTTAVTSGVLGSLDPTLLINGLYTLRLTVFDRGGNQTVATSTVQVSGNMKVGLFTLTYQDLNIPLSGIPITISRTYDSRDKGQGDFGIGWRLGLQTLRIRTNRVLGTGWVRNTSGASVVLSPTDEHKVSLTLPDGYVEVFDMNVSPTSNLGSLDFTTVTGYVPRPGTLGQLQALANNSLAILNAGAEDELVDDLTLNTYDPQLFRYTTADGTQIDIHRTEGVKQITDRNGNTLTFGPGGIIHSSGKSVVFTRDVQGRITQITDPLGTAQNYAYDLNGDLVSHTDAAGNTSRYAYDGNHGLIDSQDPAGNHAVRNDYDASGRLIAITDAKGNQITLTHNLGASSEVVRDQLGNPTVYNYDAMGNVVSKIDALGHLTTYTFDSRNNPLTETDPLGRVSSKTYDSKNNVLTSTDFDGNMTTSTYNAFGQVLTRIDPEGRTTTNIYDASGNLTQTTDPEGGITANTYDAAGNALTTTNPLGKVTSFSYDAAGNRTATTDPLGKTTTYTYDSNGRNLSETDAAGKTTLFAYDANGQPMVRTDKLGNATTVVYSNIGLGTKASSVTDPTGKVTALGFDPVGNMTQTTYPDASAATFSFDADNRRLSVTDPDAHALLFAYDALGRRTKLTLPDGTTKSMTYDAAGRELTRTDQRGNVTTMAYAPNQQTITDALGSVVVNHFDSRQHIVQTTDALGHVTSFIYDSAGNLVRTTYPDGTFKTTTFDAAKQRIAETDQVGRTTNFAYDAAGHLIRVTDALGGITAYTYDAVGNRLTQTDANGHATQMAYDAMGRVVSRTKPSGTQETFVYDALGNNVSHTDFNGQTTTFVYDTQKRLTHKHLPGGTTIAYAYTAAGLRTQAGGDSYVYDVAGRLSQEIKASGQTLTYGYDASGNRTSLITPQGTTAYTYDALNRLNTVVDAAGATTYGYDAAGRKALTSYPNGVTTAYSYDTLNRLVHVANTGPGGLISSYSYTLGPAGNRTQVVETGSATTGRTVAYAYDALYRLTQEQITEPGPVTTTISYTLDPVGNRTQMIRSGVTTNYTYDSSDRLIGRTGVGNSVTSTFDNNGNLLGDTDGVVTDAYVYDADNRLLSANGAAGSFNYAYDADGMRVGKTTGGMATAFLLDKNRDFAQVLAETTGANTLTYTYGDRLIDQQSGAGAHFYLADGQQSTRQLIAASGVVSDSYTYDAFGVPLAGTGTTANAYRYVGEQVEHGTGFYYLRARYLNPATGRFVTTDPELGNISDPLSLPRYLYGKGNPIDNRDPSGRSLAEVLFVTGALVAIGGVIGYTYAKERKSSASQRLPTFYSNIAQGIPNSGSDPRVDFEYYDQLQENFALLTGAGFVLAAGSAWIADVLITYLWTGETAVAGSWSYSMLVARYPWFFDPL